MNINLSRIPLALVRVTFYFLGRVYWTAVMSYQHGAMGGAP